MTTRWLTDLLAFQRNPLEFFANKASSTNAPLVPLHLTMAPTLLVADPGLARHVLKCDAEIIDKGRLVKKLELVVGKSILTLTGDAHKCRREILHKRLARGALQQFVPQLAAVVRQQLLELSTVRQFEVAEAAKRISMRMACVVLFGNRVLSRTDEALVIGAVDEIERHLKLVVFNGWAVRPMNYMATKRRAHAARQVLAFVVKRVRGEVRSTSVLAAFEEAGLCEEEILDEVVTMLLAGFHTTAAAAAWSLYLLASKPSAASAIAIEAKQVTDDTGEIDSSALPRAKMSMAFVKEALRLYPPAWWTSREAKVDLDIGDQRCRKGTNFIVCPWQLHRDPRYWSKPDEFNLDRAHTHAAFMPFGHGARACIGMGAALMELQILILEVSSTFELAVARGEKQPQPNGAIVLQPSPVVLDLSIQGQSQSVRGATFSDQAA